MLWTAVSGNWREWWCRSASPQETNVGHHCCNGTHQCVCGLVFGSCIDRDIDMAAPRAAVTALLVHTTADSSIYSLPVLALALVLSLLSGRYRMGSSPGEGVAAALSHRAEVFRSKLIEDFQILESISEQGKHRAPVYSSSDISSEFMPELVPILSAWVLQEMGTIRDCHAWATACSCTNATFTSFCREQNNL